MDNNNSNSSNDRDIRKMPDEKNRTDVPSPPLLPANQSVVPPALPNQHPFADIETLLNTPSTPPFSPKRRLLPSFRIVLALGTAILVDLVQIGLFPFFSEGFISPANIFVDTAAFFFFWKLLGWHIALLPGFVFEQIPMLDLAPTWTIAVLIVLRKRIKEAKLDPPV